MQQILTYLFSFDYKCALDVLEFWLSFNKIHLTPLQCGYYFPKCLGRSSPILKSQHQITKLLVGPVEVPGCDTYWVSEELAPGSGWVKNGFGPISCMLTLSNSLNSA